MWESTPGPRRVGSQQPTGYFSSHSFGSLCIGAMKKPYICSSRRTPGLPQNIFCDATTDFIMFNNEYIAKAD